MRIGTLAALDKKAAARWRSQRNRSSGSKRGKGKRGLTGAGLERAVMTIATLDPSLVAMPGTEPVRIGRGR